MEIALGTLMPAIEQSGNMGDLSFILAFVG